MCKTRACIMFFSWVITVQLHIMGLVQVDYILGSNPLGMSYMVGYGDKFPQRIHHRASSLPSMDQHPDHIDCKGGTPYFQSQDPNPNLLTGAVVGGPNASDAYPDSRDLFQEAEPTTYINAPFVGALAYFKVNNFSWDQLVSYFSYYSVITDIISYSFVWKIFSGENRIVRKAIPSAPHAKTLRNCLHLPVTNGSYPFSARLCL